MVWPLFSDSVVPRGDEVVKKIHASFFGFPQMKLVSNMLGWPTIDPGATLPPLWPSMTIFHPFHFQVLLVCGMRQFSKMAWPESTGSSWSMLKLQETSETSCNPREFNVFLLNIVNIKHIMEVEWNIKSNFPVYFNFYSNRNSSKFKPNEGPRVSL